MFHCRKMEKDSVEKTYYPKAGEMTSEWILIDAKGQNLGRYLASINPFSLRE